MNLSDPIQDYFEVMKSTPNTLRTSLSLTAPLPLA